MDRYLYHGSNQHAPTLLGGSYVTTDLWTACDYALRKSEDEGGLAYVAVVGRVVSTPHEYLVGMSPTDMAIGQLTKDVLVDRWVMLVEVSPFLSPFEQKVLHAERFDFTSFVKGTGPCPIISPSKSISTTP